MRTFLSVSSPANMKRFCEKIHLSRKQGNNTNKGTPWTASISSALFIAYQSPLRMPTIFNFYSSHFSGLRGYCLIGLVETRVEESSGIGVRACGPQFQHAGPWGVKVLGWGVYDVRFTALILLVRFTPHSLKFCSPHCHMSFAVCLSR